MEEARNAGVDAIRITDHGRFTLKQEVPDVMERFDFIVFRGAEFNTGFGIFLVYDVPSTGGWSLERDLLLKRLTALKHEIRGSRSFPVQRLETRLTRMVNLEMSDLIRQVHLATGRVF